ncbi:MAG: Gfo/Idh/MocA family oxidoreductase [Chloroflexi bacterium]|nr:Gfo/Idh/MocA family oxidoreductase [Chloroflexota bacterium]MBT5318673.1 Gfo/Idh/MocA family oxidoreductase [Chloroflexota bacterium]MBT6680520.1 Gfo/Idh/MocA family oxidoreductase [Chloroflexota bacterium]
MTSGNRRIGILGVGFGSAVHIPGFRSEGWDVAAVYSRNEERARSAAGENDVADFHTDAMELISRNDLDAVAIATPPAPHHDFAIAALRAGKHVLCEKPFALSATQAAEMRDVAAETGRTAMVAHEFRHTPQREQIKELIADGYIGEFKLASLELFMGQNAGGPPPPMSWAGSRADGGGFLGALGSHFIDGLRYWFGDVESVSGRLDTIRPDRTDTESAAVVQAETDDSFSFTLTFKNGGAATMTASAAVPSRGARISVMGTEGVLYAEQAGPNPAEDGGILGSQGGGALEAIETPARLMPFSDDRDPRLMAFRLLVRDFNRGIEEGTSPEPNFVDAWRCQQVLDAVRESSDSGQTITLD